MMKINMLSRTLLACLNKSKSSGCSRLDDAGLPGVAIEIAWGAGDFEGAPRIPKRLIADGASGISCCNLLALNSPSGKGGGGADGFGIGAPDFGVGSIPASIRARRTSGDCDEGVPTSDADLLEAGV